MEPEARAFLQRISYTIGGTLLWMAVNATFGIRYNYAFPEGGISAGNIIFYIWLVASFCILIWFYIRLWKNHLE